MFSKLQQAIKGRGESSKQLNERTSKKSEVVTGAQGGLVVEEASPGPSTPDIETLLSQLEFKELESEAALRKALCTAGRHDLKVEDVICIGNTQAGGSLTIYTDRRNPDGTDKVIPEGLSLFLVTCRVSSSYLRSDSQIRDNYPVTGSMVQCMVYCLVQSHNVKKFVRGCRNARAEFHPFWYSSVVCIIMCSPSEEIPFFVERDRLTKCLQHFNPVYVYSGEAEKQLEMEKRNYEKVQQVVQAARHRDFLSLAQDIDDLERASNKTLCQTVSCLLGKNIDIKKVICIGNTCNGSLQVYNSGILHAKNKIHPDGNSLFLVRAHVSTQAVQHCTYIRDTALSDIEHNVTKLMIYCLVTGDNITNFICDCRNTRKGSHKPFCSCKIIYVEPYNTQSKHLPANLEEGRLKEALRELDIADVIYHDNIDEEMPSCVMGTSTHYQSGVSHMNK
ncbi:DUF3023 domain-containing protein [Ehrlichia japonica]|uniref:Uncharacterized protein n=1 Tax=Ehrlichia japonica TaxID=391036 RepID=X5GLL2_9RICK|nr:DUF3023 domain-containing protein [Ehrlichia japonica]AHX05006.1 hypothetical protein EHF_0544 [Ehrlichia japonica]